jgi:hypothetical protein
MSVIAKPKSGLETGGESLGRCRRIASSEVGIAILHFPFLKPHMTLLVTGAYAGPKKGQG